jgi:spoVT/abrB-like protein
MKLTGMERPVDCLGRVVIPREIRKRLQMVDGKDSFDIFFEDDSVILKKHQEVCVICGSTDNLSETKGRMICEDCRNAIKAE